jgi:hypothetical protein
MGDLMTRLLALVLLAIAACAHAGSVVHKVNGSTVNMSATDNGWREQSW